MAEYECLADCQLEQEADKLESILTEERLMEHVNIFKVLGDLNRVKIMNVLMQHERLCVYEISRLIGATVATTSHHLILLRSVHLIKSIKEGKHVIYSMNFNHLGQICKHMTSVIEGCPHIKKMRESTESTH